jgi:hypothetical protein
MALRHIHDGITRRISPRPDAALAIRIDTKPLPYFSSPWLTLNDPNGFSTIFLALILVHAIFLPVGVGSTDLASVMGMPANQGAG